jgi:flagellar assembly protein FliH
VAEVTILLSNLLKQQFVYNEQSATRIINSNEKMEEKMRELAKIYQMAGHNAQAESLNPEFVEGILAENVTEDEAAAVPPTTPELNKDELIAEAQEEASRILEDARERADQMLNEANEKAQELYEEQKTIGYNDGAAAVEQELSQKLADMETQNSSIQQELEVEYQQKLDSMETDLVDAIIQVFDKVFHIQFEGKQDILLHLINNTLESIDSGKHFRILVSEDNWQYVDDHLDELREQLGSEVTLEVARDSKMSKSDCRIETDFGVYDCGIDVELDGLCRDIRSLCVR